MPSKGFQPGGGGGRDRANDGGSELADACGSEHGCIALCIIVAARGRKRVQCVHVVHGGSLFNRCALPKVATGGCSS